MKAYITISEMSRAIVTLVVDGKRNFGSPTTDKFVAENLGRFFYRWRIQRDWQDVLRGKTTARAALAGFRDELRLMALEGNKDARMVAQGIDDILYQCL